MLKESNTLKKEKEGKNLFGRIFYDILYNRGERGMGITNIFNITVVEEKNSVQM